MPATIAAPTTGVRRRAPASLATRAPSTWSPRPLPTASRRPACRPRCAPGTARGWCACRPAVRPVELGGDMHRQVQLAHRLEAASGSDIATGRLPPRRSMPRERPSRIAWIAATASCPWGRRAEAVVGTYRRSVPASASRSCPPCGRPARWNGRAAGRCRRRACRYSPEEKQVGQLLHVPAVLVLGDTHAVADDHALGLAYTAAAVLDIGARQARLALDLEPRSRSGRPRAHRDPVCSAMNAPSSTPSPASARSTQYLHHALRP